ncbi:MAG: ATP-dependent 6-phosphofructokinase [Candidatus Omnitrophica bacterium]|nr:ATP-dependent 6-phosphofructokinase [Candidatus Omnitrophota bacterium]
MRIGILTGGGDCAGLNQAIRAAVLRSLDFGNECLGILEGWRGLIEGKSQPLGLKEVEGIVERSGTILGTSRVNPYKEEKGVERVKENMKKWSLGALIAMGGEDTLGVAEKLFAEGVKIVGVPKTMDNDLSATDYTFGFDSSATRAMEAASALIDTGSSHRRVMILEVMGRHAGWVALFTGIASGADWILIPERKPEIKKMVNHIKDVHRRKNYALLVASEGVTLPALKVGEEEKDKFGHMILKKRKVGETLSKLIEKETGLETRVSVIGHMQRGGVPSLFDRILATRCGAKAAELIQEGKFGQMVALRGNEIVEVSLKEAVAKLKLVDEAWWSLAKVFFK